MKKKKIFVSLALLASFSLASCVKDNSTTTTTSNQGTNINENDHDRGSVDNSPSNITLPEEVIDFYKNNSEKTIKPVDVKPDDSPVDSYASEIVGEYKLLQANSGIGYKFIGWYNGDNLISTSDSFKVLISDADYVSPKFEIAPGFEYLEFKSTDTECIVLGLKEGCPIDLTLPEGVTEIAEDAFSYANICFLTLPKTLKKINNYAFANSGIVRVTFNSVPEVGVGVFNRYIIPSGMIITPIIGPISPDPVEDTSVPGHVYNNDLGIEVYLNGDLEVNQDFIDAMQNCYPIQSLDNSGYLLVDDYLFENYEAGYWRLDRYYGDDTNLVLPDATDAIPSYELYEYIFQSNVESVKLSNKVDYISDKAFSNCYNLKKVEINEGVEGIDYRAFYDCSSLSEIIIPSTVTYIDENAFEDCTKLFTIYNYSTVELTLDDAGGAPNVIEIITDKTAQSQIGVKGDFRYLLDLENNTVTLLEYLGNSKDIIIPSFDNYDIIIKDELFKYNTNIETVTLNEKVVSIGESAFEGCVNISSIDLKNVTNIGYRSFADCYNLISANLPNVEYIGGYAFNDCSSLSNVSFPKVKEIDYEAFYYCNFLKQIELPQTLESIGSYAFYGCNNLIEVINKSSLSISKGYSSNGYVAYYAKSVITDNTDSIFFEENGFVYYNDNGNKVLADVKDKTITKLVIPADVNSISLGALRGLKLEELELHMFDDNYIGYYFGASYYDNCSKYIPNTLTKVVLGTEITSLPDYALYQCSNVKNIDIPETVTYIGNFAFSYSGLEKIILKEGLESVGYSTFYKCNSLTSASLPASLTIIGENMFEDCSSLQSVKISEGTTTIYSEAFMNCKSLYTVVIPTTLSSMQYSVFEGCTTLESISLKDTEVTSLAASLFENCKNLVNIELPDTLESINSSTFSGCDKLTGTVYKNGCYFGTSDNPFRWLVKARTKTILECEVHPRCEKIYSGAFSSCYKLRKIVVPNTCTDFEGFLSGVSTLQYLEMPYYSDSYTFSRLTGLYNESIKNLQELIINGGTTIPDKAFQNYSNLKSITLSSDVTTIGKNAFEGTGLETFVASSNLEKINLQAFKDCKSLTSVDLTNMKISTYSFSDGSNNSSSTFEGCTSLTNVLLPTNLGGVASRMFYGCTALESITFPDKTTLIGTQAFANTSIKSITWNKVVEVLKGAFYGTDIETITIPSGMKLYHGTSGYGVFENCKKLKTVIWNTSYANTSSYGGKYAFRNCTSLTSFTMNSGDTLSEHMFENCTSLETIDTTNIKYYYEDCLKGSGIKNLTIPSGSKLRMYAFEGCPELTSVTFGTGVTFESGHTGFFKDCAKLTTVSLASDMTSIPYEMFKNCTSLSSFDFTNIKTINQGAFENTGFTSLELPSTITSIGKEAFNLCRKLEKVVINCNLAEGLFKNCKSLNDVTFGENITSIPTSTFFGCSGLETVSFTDSITSIGGSAFRECGLKQLVLPSTITSVGDYAFSDDSKLEKVTINGVWSTIPSSAFYRCTMLEEVTIAEGNETIGSDMFSGCTSLKNITLPSSLTTIKYRAFENCTALKSIIIPENVQTIENTIGSSTSKAYAFAGCYNLVEVYNLSNYITINTGIENENGSLGLYAKIVHISLDDNTSIVTDSNGYQFVYTDSIGYLVGYTGNSSELVLPDSFEYGDDTITEYVIKDYLFYQNNNIKSVVISDAVTSIGQYAFYNCDNLSEVIIGNNVNTIGNYSFYGCGSLVSITIPASVTSIESFAFQWCYRLTEIYNLSSLSITKGYTDNGYIGQYALIVHTSIAEKSVLVKDSNGAVYAYIAAEDRGYIVAYVGDNDNAVISGSFTYEGTVITNLKIKEAAFQYRKDLKSIIVLPGVNELGRGAFKGCEVEYLEIPDSVVNRDYSPFEGAKLVKVKLPYHLLYYIGYYYAGTSEVTSVIATCNRTDGVTISSNALRNCNKLTSVVIPKGVTYIYDYAFYGTSLSDVYFAGTPKDFESFTCSSYGNSLFTSAKKYYYSETEPTDTGNKYWHYVDDEPTPWTTE